MLRKKLKLTDIDPNNEDQPKAKINKKQSSNLWEEIWELEKKLCSDLLGINFKTDKNIGAIYNPLDYADELHIDYLKKYLKQSPKVLFLGMNPGLNGMCQTGVPFGYVGAVKNWLKIEGNVKRPSNEIPSKPIQGLECTKDEPSGKRFWGVLEEFCNTPENFFRHCFVHNICPLAFLHTSGRNITPVEIKGPSKSELNAVCLNYLSEAIKIFDPIIIISIGNYANDRVKELKKRKLLSDSIDCKLIPHPSPRAMNNHDWTEKAKKWYVDNDIVKYFKSN